MEAARQKLMDDKREWGDPVPTVPRPTADNSARTKYQALCDLCNPTTTMDRSYLQSPRTTRVLSCKDWTFDRLLAAGSNFKAATRISVTSQDLSATIIEHDKSGVPLVIEGLQNLSGFRDMQSKFTVDWIRDHSEIKEIPVRNIHDSTDTNMAFSDFVKKSRESSHFVQSGEKERFYAKDLETPQEWSQWLDDAKVVPQQLLPKCDNLLMHLPDSNRVDTMMCYIGSGDTFTPSHKDLCASNGQNLMCYAENDGSSFWFMTAQEDARKVAEYFHNVLGHEIDHETHITSVEEFAKAPFPVYIVEQKVGDLVLVPRMSCHQVVNYGGLTAKLSWSRMTVKGAAQAIYYELPMYRRVCRPETYRIRLVLYSSIKVLSKQMRELSQNRGQDSFRNGAKRLALSIQIFDKIIKEEYADNHASLPHSPKDIYLSCDFCGADIFQSFFECERCRSSHTSKDPCTICVGCFVEGRSCRCQVMQPKQVRDMDEVVYVRENSVKILKKYFDSIREPVPFVPMAKLLAGGGAFKAGCLLAESRKRDKAISCSATTRPTHFLSPGDVVPCKKCHRSMCYSHLLQDHNLHAIDILLSRPKDKDHEEHHLRHQNGKSQYKEASDKYDWDVRSTKSKAGFLEMSHLALNFQKCRPMNSSTMPGWYDTEIIVAPLTNITFEHGPASPPPPYVAEEETPNSSNNNPDDSQHSLTSAISRALSSSASEEPDESPNSINDPSAPASVAGPSSQPGSSSKPEAKKRKAAIMECVLIPPYNPRSAKAESSNSSHPNSADVISLTSDSEPPSPPPRRSGRPPLRLGRGRRVSEASSSTKRRAANSSSNRPARPVESSNFNNDLASVINASTVTQENVEAPSTLSSSSSSASSPPSTTASTSAVPLLRRVTSVRTEERQEAAGSSVALGKRRQRDADPDISDDEPAVSQPRRPDSQPTTARPGLNPGRRVASTRTKVVSAESSPVALGKRRQQHVDDSEEGLPMVSEPQMPQSRSTASRLSLNSRRQNVELGKKTRPNNVTPSVSSTSRTIQAQDAREVSAGSHVVGIGSDNIHRRVVTPTAKAHAKETAGSKGTSWTQFNKRKERSSSDNKDDSVAESSTNPVAGPSTSKLSEQVVHPSLPPTSSTDPSATVPLELFLTVYNTMQSQYTELKAQFEQYQLRASAPQQQPPTQDNNSTTYAFMQGALAAIPVLIQHTVPQAVESSIYNMAHNVNLQLPPPPIAAPSSSSEGERRTQSQWPNNRQVWSPPRGPSNHHNRRPNSYNRGHYPKSNYSQRYFPDRDRDRGQRRPSYSNYRSRPRSRSRSRSRDVSRQTPPRDDHYYRRAEAARIEEIEDKDPRYESRIDDGDQPFESRAEDVDEDQSQPRSDHDARLEETEPRFELRAEHRHEESISGEHDMSNERPNNDNDTRMSEDDSQQWEDNYDKGDDDSSAQAKVPKPQQQQQQHPWSNPWEGARSKFK